MTIRPRYLIALMGLNMVLILVFGIGTVKLGRILERAERNEVIDALMMTELLRRSDSVVADVAYRILRRSDSVIRARRNECGPLMEKC